MIRKNTVSMAALAAGLALFTQEIAYAQANTAPPMAAASQPVAPAPQAAASAMTTSQPVAPLQMVKLPEGTEVKLMLQEKLSSASSSEGDTFNVVTTEIIPLSTGNILPPGYSGRGEVTHAEHNGWLGKSGQLNIKVDYIKVGDVRVHLRGNKGGEGNGNTGNIVVAAVFLGLFAVAVHGHSIVYPVGTTMTAFVDADTEIPLPVAAPPSER